MEYQNYDGPQMPAKLPKLYTLTPWLALAGGFVTQFIIMFIVGIGAVSNIEGYDTMTQEELTAALEKYLADSPWTLISSVFALAVFAGGAALIFIGINKAKKDNIRFPAHLYVCLGILAFFSVSYLFSLFA